MSSVALLRSMEGVVCADVGHGVVGVGSSSEVSLDLRGSGDFSCQRLQSSAARLLRTGTPVASAAPVQLEGSWSLVRLEVIPSSKGACSSCRAWRHLKQA